MSTSSPRLGDTYTLMELPRTPDLALSQRVVVAESQSEYEFAVSDKIDVGISKSIIASYVLKPSPKLVWSYPLSPSTSVNSLDVTSRTCEAGDVQMYAIGLKDRNKPRLLLILKQNNETIASAQLKLPEPAVAVKFSSGNSIYVLLQSGAFLLAQYQDGLDTDIVEIAHKPSNFSVSLAPDQGTVPALATRASDVEFHTFIQKGSFNYKNSLLFYAARSKKSHSVTYRLIALNGSKSFEIFQVSVGAVTSSLRNKCTYSEGVIYVFDDKSKTISSRLLMKPQVVVKEVSVAALFKEFPTTDSVSLIAVAPERLLLSYKSSVNLINFKFESLLSEHTNTSGNDVFLPFALPIQGKDANSSSTFALYLNLEDNTKLCRLKSIQVDVGLNLLCESLGKALSQPQSKQWSGLPHLAGTDLAREAKRNYKKLENVYKKLQETQSQKDTEQFDAALLGFFRTSKKSSSKASPHFTESADSILDHRFIESVVSLIFTLDEQKSVQIIAEDFAPQKAISYLLTHPLFPVSHTRGLLELLSALEQPELLKQAIRDCPVLTLDELMAEFTNLVEVSDELDPVNKDEVVFVAEFLRLTIDRLLQHFSLAQITKELSKVLSNDSDADSKPLERMLNVLINVNTPSSWSIVQAVIDVGGLFGWSLATISVLSEIVDSKVDALSQNSQNLTLTNQALSAHEQKKQKNSKKTQPKVVDNIHEIASARAQLESILTISNSTTNRKLLESQGLDLAEQIPTYSREKLIF